jgi:hypothetical protein
VDGGTKIVQKKPSTGWARGNRLWRKYANEILANYMPIIFFNKNNGLIFKS